jgi:hypothetical protein
MPAYTKTGFRTTWAIALAVGGMVASVGAASAMEAAAKSAVNVRTGPGTSFSVVDKLEADEIVNITECAPSGWCFVEHSGPDGWVSASFLIPAEEGEGEEESAGAGSNPDCGFGFSIGSGGPSLTINCGDAPPPPAPPAADDEGDSPDEADGPQVCFYTNSGFDGASFCMAEGTKNSLNGTFKDKISSVEVSGGLKAKLCVDNNLGGYCKTVTTDTANLPSQINNKANSILVFTGEEPIGPIVLNPGVIKVIPGLLVPQTFSTGPIDWKQTWEINLDNGTQASGSGNDLWYHAVTNTEKYIEPINGAKIAIGDFGQHGWDGCKAASFTSAKLAISDAPVGSYICVKTNEGRISEFRVNGFNGTTMKIGYTTWAN